jgi:hypothetical protein
MIYELYPVTENVLHQIFFCAYGAGEKVQMLRTSEQLQAFILFHIQMWRVLESSPWLIGWMLLDGCAVYHHRTFNPFRHDLDMNLCRVCHHHKNPRTCNYTHIFIHC